MNRQVRYTNGMSRFFYGLSGSEIIKSLDEEQVNRKRIEGIYREKITYCETCGQEVEGEYIIDKRLTDNYFKER